MHNADICQLPHTNADTRKRIRSWERKGGTKEMFLGRRWLGGGPGREAGLWAEDEAELGLSSNA